MIIGKESLSNPINLGGSQLGVMACKQEYVRNIPGRLVGETHDSQGRQGFVLTLQTREQHIRRQKATSNICTSHALNALASTVHMALLGAGRLSELGSFLIAKPKEVAQRINNMAGWKAPLFDSHHFREFAAVSDADPELVNRELLKEGITGGLLLRGWYPELGNVALYCITECCSDEDIERLLGVLEDSRNLKMNWPHPCHSTLNSRTSDWFVGLFLYITHNLESMDARNL